MLRRLKNDDASSGSGDGNSGGTSIGPPRSGDQMSSLQRYRSQTMKDYGLMIEYKHLRQHVPAGIYVLPSFDESRVWYGTIFVHTGLYRNGIFKFTIKLPESYNGPGTYPRIAFSTNVFHPYVNPETRELDLTPKFPQWDPEFHYMVAVLTYLKSIFYMKDFPPAESYANPAALEMFRHNPENYVLSVETSVEQSLETVYNNEPGSTLRFTKHNPAHDHLRKDLFAQLAATNDAQAGGDNNQQYEDKASVDPAISLLTATINSATSNRTRSSSDMTDGSVRSSV